MISGAVSLGSKLSTEDLAVQRNLSSQSQCQAGKEGWEQAASNQSPISLLARAPIMALGVVRTHSENPFHPLSHPRNFLNTVTSCADRHTFEGAREWMKKGHIDRQPAYKHETILPITSYRSSEKTSSRLTLSKYVLSSNQLIKLHVSNASLGPQLVKNLPAMQETQVWSLVQEDPLEKGMVTYPSIFVWRSPWTVEPSGLQLIGCKESHRTEQLSLSSSTYISHPSANHFRTIFLRRRAQNMGITSSLAPLELPCPFIYLLIHSSNM